MSYKIVRDCEMVEYNDVREVLIQAGLTARPVELLKRAFSNSYLVVFVYDGDKLIGVGRAISDGAYEAGLYDIAVLPAYQGQGLGRAILKELLARLEGINVILYARPGAEDFYRKAAFSKLLTGMIRFVDPQTMRNRGFIE